MTKNNSYMQLVNRFLCFEISCQIKNKEDKFTCFLLVLGVPIYILKSFAIKLQHPPSALFVWVKCLF